MKTVILSSAAAFAIALAAVAPVAAGIPNPAPVSITFPTDYDGFVADKAKKTAKNPAVVTSE